MNVKSNKRDRDYVVGLLSGRTESRRTRDGETVTVFLPKISNKHQPLDTIFAKTNKSIQDIFITEGVHQPRLNIDQNEFVKTSDERTVLKKLKAAVKSSVVKAGFNPKKRMNETKPVFVYWRAFD